MASQFKDSSMDCIFVDGDHTYNGAKTDIDSYYPILRPGGLMIFDDHGDNYPGVVQAVKELVDSRNLTLVKVNEFDNYYVQVPVLGQR
jgi:predicted O-methyltransferase YrrM